MGLRLGEDVSDLVEVGTRQNELWDSDALWLLSLLCPRLFE